MKKKMVWSSIVAAIVALVLAAVTTHLDTEWVELYGGTFTYVWYVIFYANLVMMPWAVYNR